MLHLSDMASSPQYLASSAHSPEHVDLDSHTTVLLDASASLAQPTTVAYSHPDQGPYSELAQVSQFGTSPLVDDHMLTPVSSAASPPLPSKIKSQYDHEEESLQYSQQPTPPPHAAMYSPYPEYTLHHASQATSSMTMQPTVAETTPHDFFVQRSPGPEDTNPPPPAEFYLGAFGASSVSVAPKTEPYPTYLHNTAGMESPMDLLRADVNAGSYTHRPMTTTGIAQTPSMPPLLHNSPQEQYNPRPLRKLSPARTASKRDPARKASRRRRNSPTIKPLHQIHEQVDSDLLEDDGYPDEDVTLDDKASPDLQRLWDIRKRYLSRKGNGMWEDILADYYQGENIGNDDKKTQAKAGLQMKVHRTLLKHAVWPQRDESALLRAYRRWEENRYIEIHRLFEEELAGRKKGYDWKSQHIEAQLVKMGLEELERDRDSKARKRKQVSAKHQSRGSTVNNNNGARQSATAAVGSAFSSLSGQHRLPAVPTTSSYHEQSQSAAAYYTTQSADASGHYRAASYDATTQPTLAQELGAHRPELTDAQREELVDQVLQRGPYGLADQDIEHDGEHIDPRMVNYVHHPSAHHLHSHHNHHHHHHHSHHEQPHGLPALPPWEDRSRTTSISLIHPALTGSGQSSPSAMIYGHTGEHSTSTGSGANSASPEFDVHRSAPMQTLARASYV